MSEQEAIEILKDIQENYKYGIQHSSSSTSDELNSDIKNNKAIETMLKVFEKQDKEIKKLKESNKDILRKLKNRVKEVRKLSKYALYKNEFKRLNEHIAEKDKIIDLMAEEMNNNYDFDEMCANCGNDSCLDGKEDYGKECVKEYFEKKVRNEKWIK